ncbi:DnaJ-domain-containing protein [Tilletiaria anomala UBC 951]|uniref:DnaJ-domain-containing protein n=1 Tax=Tilletiaria anomala (strain ATCC 24038 / CBS 436.72 / UBC 951) TaxID=1037660 RepID=A0A066VPC8_TILAU|nr:DnaJ-domain-containing protein [Tilletiaria anomala UBC 951]KDN43306.1 DnaJ-domain-containing protein [Tilletiaria anomala UBC 951]
MARGRIEPVVQLGRGRCCTLFCSTLLRRQRQRQDLQPNQREAASSSVPYSFPSAARVGPLFFSLRHQSSDAHQLRKGIQSPDDPESSSDKRLQIQQELFSRSAALCLSRQSGDGSHVANAIQKHDITDSLAGPEDDDFDWLAGLTEGRATANPVAIDSGMLMLHATEASQLSWEASLARDGQTRKGLEANPFYPVGTKFSSRGTGPLYNLVRSTQRRSAHTAASKFPESLSSSSARVSSSAHRSSPSSRNVDAPYHAHPLRFPTHILNPTPYEVFHLSPNATAQDVKARYYELVKLLHPDRHFSARRGVCKERGANEKELDVSSQNRAASQSIDLEQAHFKVIVAAYELLGDSRKRAVYDKAGLGWQKGGTTNAAGPSPPWWGGRPPRTPDEWAAFNAWSIHLRRTAAAGGTGNRARTGWEFRGSAAASHGGPEGHDAFGWQRYAGAAEYGSFYGFKARDRMAREEREKHGGNTCITSNARLFGSILFVTWLVAALQYQRLACESQCAVERANKHHLDAVKSLKEAREMARSQEGKLRYQEMRRRAKESSVLREVERLEARAAADAVRLSHDEQSQGPGEADVGLLTADNQSTLPGVIGHGGPSGKEAHDARRDRHERLRNQQTRGVWSL